MLEPNLHLPFLYRLDIYIIFYKSNFLFILVLTAKNNNNNNTNKLKEIYFITQQRWIINQFFCLVERERKRREFVSSSRFISILSIHFYTIMIILTLSIS